MNNTSTTDHPTGFLPITREDMNSRGWDRLDFIIVSGDAYIDHPSFGHALIGRLLESEGYRTGIIAQPDWKDPEAFRILGRPRLAFLVTSGNIDSMVNHYTANRKPRSEDAYSPGGRAGLRPDHAAVVYAHMARQAFKGVPVILGGVEASLRRLSHYDYWSDTVRRSILLTAKADLALYGMAERSVLEVARLLADGVPVSEIRDVRGTVWKTSDDTAAGEALRLPAHEEITADPRAFASSFRIQSREADPVRGRRLIEPSGHQFAVQNPPQAPLTQAELDRVYELPYTRMVHPSYDADGGVPALEEVRFSLVSSRGCFGGCSFCALSFHQGRIIQARSHESLIREATLLTRLPGFKGYIHDVGGPTANFRAPACQQQTERGACADRQCLYPDPCRSLVADHSDYLALLRKLRVIPGVKKVFVRSGIRFDYLLADGDRAFFRELVRHHVSGQLKVAPEHISERVLRAMGKPAGRIYRTFAQEYRSYNREEGKDQYLVPYFIASHPGSTLADAIELAEYLRDEGITPQQVQDFYPTPGTVATCMYHTGIDPRTMEPIFVPRGQRERSTQRALLQYRKPENYRLVLAALREAGREDLIGFGKECLIAPPGREPAAGRKPGGDRGKLPAAGRRPAVRKPSDRRPAGDRKPSGDHGKAPASSRKPADRKPSERTTGGREPLDRKPAARQRTDRSGSGPRPKSGSATDRTPGGRERRPGGQERGPGRGREKSPEGRTRKGRDGGMGPDDRGGKRPAGRGKAPGDRGRGITDRERTSPAESRGSDDRNRDDRSRGRSGRGRPEGGGRGKDSTGRGRRPADRDRARPADRDRGNGPSGARSADGKSREDRGGTRKPEAGKKSDHRGKDRRGSGDARDRGPSRGPAGGKSGGAGRRKRSGPDHGKRQREG